MTHGKIGIFDSGIGGLSIARAWVATKPDCDLIYLADQKNTPYGDRSGEEIVDLTKKACEFLFEQGANIAVLGCNTASAVALRRLQSGWLKDYRQKIGRKVNILGIIVPTIEAATGLPWEHEAERRGVKIEQVEIIGVFSTVATARARVYEIEIDKRRQDIAVFSEACSGLADMIERGAPVDDLLTKIKGHIESLRLRVGKYPDKAILGCTHYELISDLFKKALPETTTLIHQPPAVANALSAYVSRHSDYDLSENKTREFYTTGDVTKQSALSSAFWGADVPFKSVSLTD